MTSRMRIMQIIVGGFFFALGFIINNMFILAYIALGAELLYSGMKELWTRGPFGIKPLMGIATIGALALHEFGEAAAVVLLFRMGEIFEQWAVRRTKDSIDGMLEICADNANLERDGVVTSIHAKDVKVGDIIIIKAGERVPLDGVIIEGESGVDTSALTGESTPRKAAVNDTVSSGYVNQAGVLKVRVTKDYDHSAASRIVRLVRDARGRKAPLEHFVDRFVKYYTPIVVFVAIVFGVVSSIIMGDWIMWAHRALVVLVISCPCALVISVPLTFFAGIGAASRMGVVVRGGSYLAALSTAKSVGFDKTGTLTHGVFEVTEVRAMEGWKKSQVMDFAASAAEFSNHPISLSILRHYKKQPKRAQGHEDVIGRGVRAVLDGVVIFIGRTRGERLGVIVNGEFIGSIVVSDKIRARIKPIIEDLGDEGIDEIAMLTGDSMQEAHKVAEKAGIKKVFAELMPEEKVTYFDALPRPSIYVGDGINDAPVLASADIGVAMSGVGRDIAVEAADVVIMDDEPERLLHVIKIAKRTRGIAWQNICLALSVKAVAMMLGLFGVITMWEAVAADVGATVVVVTNAMRAIKRV